MYIKFGKKCVVCTCS